MKAAGGRPKRWFPCGHGLARVIATIKKKGRAPTLADHKGVRQPDIHCFCGFLDPPNTNQGPLLHRLRGEQAPVHRREFITHN
jgi:hypothetical protein